MKLNSLASILAFGVSSGGRHVFETVGFLSSPTISFFVYVVVKGVGNIVVAEGQPSKTQSAGNVSLFEKYLFP